VFLAELRHRHGLQSLETAEATWFETCLAPTTADPAESSPAASRDVLAHVGDMKAAWPSIRWGRGGGLQPGVLGVLGTARPVGARPDVRRPRGRLGAHPAPGTRAE
jgi:hypothetical protein